MASISPIYERAVRLEMPAGVTGQGWAAAAGFWPQLLGAFPRPNSVSIIGSGARTACAAARRVAVELVEPA